MAKSRSKSKAKPKPKPKKALRSGKKIGLIPGTPTYIGNKEDNPFYIDIIDYTKDTCTNIRVSDTAETLKYSAADSVTWININGLNNIADIQKLGDLYKLHPLLLEDIVDTRQRPKIDEYEDYLFMVFKMIYYHNNDLYIEHISMVLGSGYVLTFQESETDVFDPLRLRINEARGRVRSEKAGYLLFTILDAIIDHYFLIIEALGDQIEALENTLFENQSNKNIAAEIQNIKKEALKIRRSIFPLREVLNRLEKTTSTLIEEHVKNYYRDLHDHAIQIIESIEIYRDMIWSLIDIHMSVTGNKMNNIMKVLTIIATIFIPLTFIAGIYGMNFDHMPELHYKYSYYVLWGIMILLFIGMLYYFKRKKWL